MLLSILNIGSTMGTIKDYQPTPEQIKSHQDHEKKRRLFCKQLELTHIEKWKQGKKK